MATDRWTICANPKCQYHNRGIPDPHMKVVQVIDEVQATYLTTKTVERYLYRDNRTGNQFYFCETCHNACEMVAMP